MFVIGGADGMDPALRMEAELRLRNFSATRRTRWRRWALRTDLTRATPHRTPVHRERLLHFRLRDHALDRISILLREARDGASSSRRRRALPVMMFRDKPDTDPSGTRRCRGRSRGSR